MKECNNKSKSSPRHDGKCLQLSKPEKDQNEKFTKKSYKQMENYKH